ncbi:MAG: ribonuclease Y [Planctomycetes bacterium]|nr:ribonuclease Y [Planctomycetota bacterium]
MQILVPVAALASCTAMLMQNKGVPTDGDGGGPAGLYVVIGAAVGVVAGIALFLLYHKMVGSRVLQGANREREAARREAEGILRKAEVDAREAALRHQQSVEQEIAQERKEIKALEKRVLQKEETLERKFETLQGRERQIEERDGAAKKAEERLREREREAEGVIAQQKEKLAEVARLSEADARRHLLDRLDDELKNEQGALIKKYVERAREEADKQARDIVITAMQRLASTQTTESTVSTVAIPSDEMKGRIIGRDGRNIRAFESQTGVDVIVDDTPGVIVVSAFDAVRREVARRTMERLIQDGRIHPTRIEEVAKQTQEEVEKEISTTGKQVCDDLGIYNIHPKIQQLMGRLKYRTSYGQNVLAHSVEVAHLAALMAGELKLDEKLALRCALLHDCGKAIDHEQEGGHPKVGMEFAKKHGEGAEVCDAIGGHHFDFEPQFVFTIITAIADAISASRPGARRESLEHYLKRLERLEQVATSFDGVTQAFAIQAGREVRVIVDAQKISDDGAVKVARDIAQNIENELTYPGEVRVTLVRETRVVDYAR